MEARLDDRIKAEILGIRCFNSYDNSKDEIYKLIPISEWTKEICDELNKTDFLKKYDIDLGLGESNEDFSGKFSNLKKIEGDKYKVNKICIYNQLPEGVDFVRLNHCIILRKDDNDDSLCSKIESSIIENLGVISSFDTKKGELLNETTPICSNNYTDYKEKLDSLRQICAVSARFSTKKRPMNGADNNIWYELLQNANDHIPSDVKEKNLEVEFNEIQKTFTLKYPDMGFSVRDFLAVCTEGNSGNVLSDENREGRKGTGFKSVYNLFDKVTIVSGPVKCVLEDVERVISIDKNGQVSIADHDEKKKNENYYPIPDFSYTDSNEKKTTITLHTSHDLSNIKKYIFGEDCFECDMESLQDQFKKKEDYLFLDNIEKISFSFIDRNEEKGGIFDKVKHIKDNYIRIEYDFTDTKVNKDCNPNWKNRSEELFDKKKKTSFLFPKEVDFLNGGSESRTRVYCTLPIDESGLSVPFYVNIPLLELKDDRKSIADVVIGDFSLKEWNQFILIEGLMNGFKKIVEDTKNDDIGLSNWYKYFPYEYLKQDKSAFGINWAIGQIDLKEVKLKELGEVKVEGLRAVKFMQVTTSTRVADERIVASAAISDLVQSEKDIAESKKSIFLPCKMYDWIHRNINDTFSSTESGENNGIPPVSFVYYDYEIGDESKVIIIEDKINEKIGIPVSSSLLYLREKEGSVGKILIELKKYLLNDYKKKLTDYKKKKNGYKKKLNDYKKKLNDYKKKENGYKKKLNDYKKELNDYKKELNDYKKKQNAYKKNEKQFYDWLKILLGSKDFIFLYKDAYIYQAFFHANNVDFSKGKYHWLKTSDDTYCSEKMGNYESIDEIIKQLKRHLYDNAEYCFQPDEQEYSIKYCFNDLIESPYEKYTYEKKDGNWKKGSSEFRTDGIAQICNSISQKVLCYYTGKLLSKELLSELSNDKIIEIREWVEKNKELLFVKNTCGKIVRASDIVYYTEKKITSDLVVDYGENFFTNLENALSLSDEKSNVFEQYQGEENFITQILERYDVGVWINQAIIFFRRSTHAIKLIIFRYIINKSDTVVWNDTYSDLVKGLSRDELWKEGKKVFKIGEETRIYKLPQYVLDAFDNKVSLQEKNKKVSLQEKDKIVSLQDKDKITTKDSLQKIVNDRMYILPCEIGNKSLYCKAEIPNGDEVYILFNESTFGTLLRKVFDCNDFSENKIYTEMLCNDTDMIKDSEVQQSEEFTSDINDKVDDLIKKWMHGEKDDFKKALVGRFDVRKKDKGKKGKWFHARGYGNSNYDKRRCPICQGILLSEMNALVMRNITYKIDEYKYYFPMLMCKNCGESINYAETVELKIIECNKNQVDIFKVSDNSFAEFNIIYSMIGREEKCFKCKVSFLNRYIWKRIKKKDDENRNEGKEI